MCSAELLCCGGTCRAIHRSSEMYFYLYLTCYRRPHRTTDFCPRHTAPPLPPEPLQYLLEQYAARVQQQHQDVQHGRPARSEMEFDAVMEATLKLQSNLEASFLLQVEQHLRLKC